MSHNARIRAPGLWIAGTLLPGEMELFDAAQFKAVNGDDGGTWSPANKIIFGGAGLEVTGPFAAGAVGTMVMPTGGSLSLTGNAFIALANGTHLDLNSGAILNVNSGADIEVESGGEITVKSGGFINLAGGASIEAFSGAMVRIGNGASLTLLGLATIDSSGATLNGTLTQAAAVTQTGMVTRSGAGGRTRIRTSVLLANQLNNISVATDLAFYVQSDNLARTHTLLVTSAPVPQAGERLTVNVKNTGSAAVIFKSEGSANLTCTTTGSVVVTFVFDGALWRMAGGCVNDAGGLPGTIVFGVDA
ncbi:MAG: hypothetical protein HOW73_32960 [Polyangiaceae bacterium]|nr:hypothetical protein [Polyangiaceae bacterium]